MNGSQFSSYSEFCGTLDIEGLRIIAEPQPIGEGRKSETGEDVFEWALLVGMKFDNESPCESTRNLARDLELWSSKFGCAPEVQVLVKLNPSFPIRAPSFRVLKPIFEYGTGGITNGYLSDIPELTKLGWYPLTELRQVFRLIRENFARTKARLIRDSFGFYGLQPYESSYSLLEGDGSYKEGVDTSQISMVGDTFELVAYSSCFCENVMHARIAPDFHYGNKVLLPNAILERMLCAELPGLRVDSPSSSNQAEAAPQLIVPPRSRFSHASLLTTQEDSITTSSAMTFQIEGASGRRLFVGVAEFSAPEPTVVVLPLPLMSQLGIPEGASVSMRQAKLPRAAHVTLQPLSANFSQVSLFTDMDHRAFMELSLRRYGCLQRGAVIVCTGVTPDTPLDVDISAFIESTMNTDSSSISGESDGFSSSNSGNESSSSNPNDRSQFHSAEDKLSVKNKKFPKKSYDFLYSLASRIEERERAELLMQGDSDPVFTPLPLFKVSLAPTVFAFTVVDVRVDDAQLNSSTKSDTKSKSSFIDDTSNRSKGANMLDSSSSFSNDLVEEEDWSEWEHIPGVTPDPISRIVGSPALNQSERSQSLEQTDQPLHQNISSLLPVHVGALFTDFSTRLTIDFLPSMEDFGSSDELERAKRSREGQYVPIAAGESTKKETGNAAGAPEEFGDLLPAAMIEDDPATSLIDSAWTSISRLSDSTKAAAGGGTDKSAASSGSKDFSQLSDVKKAALLRKLPI